MEKVAISTRITSSPHQEWRDSLAHDWPDYLWEQGFQAILIPNHLDSCREYLRDAVLLILSGGDDILLQPTETASNDPPAIRDATEYLLLKTAIAKNLPVLGVCRGTQLINAFYGGTIIALSDGSHVATEHEVSVDKGALADALNDTRLQVNSFHQQRIATLGDGLNAVARAEDGQIEAIEHESDRIAGVMWHPERRFADAKSSECHAQFIRRLLKSGFSRRS